jgi:hypothetical protein
MICYGCCQSDGSTLRRPRAVDLLDRVLAGGVVIVGDITLSIAEVDLVRVSLRALVTSISGLMEAMDDSQEYG